jgi:hypothetical protein
MLIIFYLNVIRATTFTVMTNLFQRVPFLPRYN